MNAVQTEGAIHVAHLAWLKQGQFTATNHHQIRDRFASPANAVQRVATGAHLLAPHLHLKRRKRGRHKVELADGANKLAERSVFEQSIHEENAQKISDDQPGSPPGRGPQVKQFISKKNQYEERDRNPFI